MQHWSRGRGARKVSDRKTRSQFVGEASSHRPPEISPGMIAAQSAGPMMHSRQLIPQVNERICAYARRCLRCTRFHRKHDFNPLRTGMSLLVPRHAQITLHRCTTFILSHELKASIFARIILRPLFTYFELVYFHYISTQVSCSKTFSGKINIQRNSRVKYFLSWKSLGLSVKG